MAAPTSAAEQSTPSAFPDRLSFPEAPEEAPAVIAASDAPQQSMVALPTPQFTGVTAVAALAILLSCRKSILKLVS